MIIQKFLDLFEPSGKGLLKFVAQNKKRIIRGFYPVYFILIALLVYIGSGYKNGSTLELAVFVGPKLGVVAMLLFCLVISPGIMRRFALKSAYASTVVVLRRYLGILMFVVAFVHYQIVKVLPSVAAGEFPPKFLVFELFGLAALTLTAALFVTSNDLSVKKLGKWWGRIHALVYVIVWLIFGHVLLFAKLEPVTVVIGIFAVLELTSLIYARTKRG